MLRFRAENSGEKRQAENSGEKRQGDPFDCVSGQGISGRKGREIQTSISSHRIPFFQQTAQWFDIYIEESIQIWVKW